MARSIEGSTTPRLPDNVWRIDQAWDQIPALIERLNMVISTSMPALYDQLNEHGVRPVVGNPVEIPIRP